MNVLKQTNGGLNPSLEILLFIKMIIATQIETKNNLSEPNVH